MKLELKNKDVELILMAHWRVQQQHTLSERSKSPLRGKKHEGNRKNLTKVQIK